MLLLLLVVVVVVVVVVVFAAPALLCRTSRLGKEVPFALHCDSRVIHTAQLAGCEIPIVDELHETL